MEQGELFLRVGLLLLQQHEDLRDIRSITIAIIFRDNWPNRYIAGVGEQAVLVARSEEVTFLALGLIVAGRVGSVPLVPVVETLAVHGAGGANRIILVIGMALRSIAAVAVARATPRRHIER